MFLFLNMEASTVHSRHPEKKKKRAHPKCPQKLDFSGLCKPYRNLGQQGGAQQGEGDKIITWRNNEKKWMWSLSFFFFFFFLVVGWILTNSPLFFVRILSFVGFSSILWLACDPLVVAWGKNCACIFLLFCPIFEPKKSFFGWNRFLVAGGIGRQVISFFFFGGGGDRLLSRKKKRKEDRNDIKSI